jgi:hypothetical protein
MCTRRQPTRRAGWAYFVVRSSGGLDGAVVRNRHSRQSYAALKRQPLSRRFRVYIHGAAELFEDERRREAFLLQAQVGTVLGGQCG